MMKRSGIFVVLIGCCVFIYTVINLSTFPEVKKGTERRHNIISKSRIFPQGGGSERLDQPWLLPSVPVIDNFQNGRFIVSNFSYSKGLGNLMFQLASLVGVAAKNNATVVLPRTNLLRRSFTLSHANEIAFAEQATFDKLLKKGEKRAVVQKDCCSFNSYNLEFTNGFTVLNGYFQNKRYFDPQLYDKLAKLFNFHMEVRDMASDFIRNAMLDFSFNTGKQEEGVPGDEAVLVEGDPLSSSTYVIGVHVRRGMDIQLNERNKAHGHVAAPLEYYKRAMNMAKGDREKVMYIICSDDIVWAKKHFRNEEFGSVFFCPGKYREVDMCILSAVDGLVLSTGTFSWWSAYLNQNAQDIYYYSGWPRPHSDLDKMVNKTEYFVEDWIALE